MGAVNKRRRTTIRNTLLAGVAAIALIAAAPEASVAQDNKPGFFGSIEGRYLFGGDSDNTDIAACVDRHGYCYRVDGFPHDDTVDSPDNGFGGRLMLGYRFPANSPQWDVAVAVSGGRLDGDDEFVETAAIGASPFYTGYTLYAFAEGPAEAETDYYVIDLEAGYNVGIGNPGRVRVFGGVRFAKFDQDVKFSGDFDFYSEFFEGIYYDSFEAEREVDYWGVGPRLGVSGAFPLGESNFSVVGGLAGAVLFGERETTDHFTEGAGFGYVGTESEDDFEIVGNIEGELGLSFTDPGTNFDIAAGWRLEKWFNVNNTDWDLLGPVAGRVGSNDADQIMHGPFLRLSIRR